MVRYTERLILALLFVGGVVTGIGGYASAQCFSDKLLASDGQPDDHFGSVSISGSTALIGASGKDDNGADSGAAYVFEYTGTGWAETDKLLAPDGAAGDAFGRVALSGDVAVIGARYDDDLGSNSGSAYVFERVGTAWVFTQKLTASDGAAGDGFGGAVAISRDRIAVAARYHDIHPKRGAVYIFDRLGNTWVETAEVTLSGGYGLSIQFATSVAVFGDRLLIGAPGYEEDPALCHGCGAGLVFELVGSSWVYTADLTPTYVPGAGSGWSVSLWGDTAIVGVGNLIEDAYVYEYDGASWAQVASLLPADAVLGDGFGSSVAVSGSHVLVGSPYDDDLGSSSGSAYSYERMAGSWTQNAKFQANDGATQDYFGGVVSISEDGTSLISAGGDDDLGSSSGSAHVIPWYWEASTYCITFPNSVGPGANICWLGTTSLSADSFHLVASECPPNQFLMFYYGAGQEETPFGNGWRCVNAGGWGVFRFKPFLTDATGTAIMKVDYTVPPLGGSGGGAWIPGDTWYCQGWYRDPAGGSAEFNLTDGLEVVVWP